jgi:hypothetical protein
MTTKNHLKGESYTHAFRRINEAIEQGFYLEAVTLAESIISDRLLSFVKYHNGKVTVRTSFHTLINSAKKFNATQVLTKSGEDLFDALDRWRIERNACVHSFTKSEPGTAPESIYDFNRTAEKASKSGKTLARHVCSWHKKMKASK